ncbi:MAG: alpha amylase catalytic region [Bacteroidetes bacterium]|nr:alpha amylase catalytic region [Bacteroidota bacterium]
MQKLLFVLFLLSCNTFLLIAQIERIEPACWWIGMKNPNLQLLVHGKNISTYQVSINYPGVKIVKVNKVENSNYLFVDLTIDSKIAQAGTFDIKLQQNGRTEDSYTYELKSRRPGSANRLSFTSADVVYLLMPDRFANGNPSNDNVDSQPEKVNRALNYGRHGGDIKGIQDHLDYIRQLGATAIWSTPLLENNYTQYTYHGYAISDFYKVDPRYGSNDDYARLIASAHQKGLKIIMDMVSNHGGIGAWWMKDLPMADWIHQWPTFTRSNHKAVTTKDIHAAQCDIKLDQEGWFDTTMPDMNQNNPYFWTYYIQNNIWWIEFADLDGIRMDTYPYNDRNAMSQWAKAILDEYPQFNLVGETWLHSSEDIAFWQKDAVNSLHYNSNLPTPMDFVMNDALSTCFNEQGNGWNEQGMNRLYNTIAKDYLFANPNNLFIFTENHDTQRYNNTLKGDLAKYKMALSFLMTTRGIPQIYYGSEIGMSGDKNKGDGDIRRDFPGGWTGDSINAFTPQGRTEFQKNYYEFTSKLLNWRKSKEVIRTGKLLHYVPENDIYVYFRYNKKETIMVILNNNDVQKILKTNRFTEALKHFKQGIDVITEKTYALAPDLTLPPKSALILELE